MGEDTGTDKEITTSTSGVGTGESVATGEATATPTIITSEVPVSGNYGNSEKDTFSKNVPKEFENEPWVKELTKAEKPNTEMFKQMKNLQTKLGERPGVKIPTAESTPEERLAFDKARGVPDTIEGYEIKPIEWGEDKEWGAKVEATRTPERLKAFKELAIKEGITPETLNRLLELNDREVLKDMKAMGTKSAEESKKAVFEFEQTGQKTFGSRWDQVKDNTRKLILSATNEQDRKEFAELPERAVFLLTKTLDQVHKSLVREDGFTPNNTISSGNISRADQIAEGEKLMQHEAFSDFLHPEHERVTNKVNQLFGTNQKKR
jgi:hypothetical protein